MHSATAPLPTPAPDPLAKLLAAIDAKRAELGRLESALAVMLELLGRDPAAAIDAGRPPVSAGARPIVPAVAPPAARPDAAAAHNAAKSEAAKITNRLAVARALLAGPLGFNALTARFTGRGHSWLTRALRGSSWFEKSGPPPAGSVDARPWALTDVGRREAGAMLAAEALGGEPAATPRPRPRDPHPAPEPLADRERETSAADLRPNPDLDAEFEDLFMPEARGGKPTPRPGLNGTGRGHRPPAMANGRH